MTIQEMIAPWVEFAICSGLIIWAASSLSRYADILSEKTGLSKGWIGVILVAGVTSLPELASGGYAVSALHAPDLAAGVIMGSCLFNLFLIAVMDLAYQPGRVLSREQDAHILTAGLGVVLLSVVAIAVLLGPPYSNAGLFGVGFLTMILIAFYLIGARLVAHLESERVKSFTEKEARVYHYQRISTRRTYAIFILSALAVIGLGIWLSSIGERLATVSGLSQSFVGNLFLAISTSLPEVAASLAAVRLGAVDLAIGNALGSNLVNLFILALFDLVDGRANFWSSLGSTVVFPIVMAILMTGVVIISLRFRAHSRTSRKILSWDGVALVGLYLAAMLILYQK